MPWMIIQMTPFQNVITNEHPIREAVTPFWFLRGKKRGERGKEKKKKGKRRKENTYDRMAHPILSWGNKILGHTYRRENLLIVHILYL